MGCDIHCYMEYKKAGDDRWCDFGGRINPGRNYWMFGAMAGVRADHIPHLEPKGCPADIASEAFEDYWTFITEDGGDGDCTPSQAERYMQYGSTLWKAGEPLIHNRVSSPDWHTHSWLTPDEFEIAIAAYLKASGYQINTPRLPMPAEVATLATPELKDEGAIKYLSEYWAILAALRCFEAQGHAARLVFWFDN